MPATISPDALLAEINAGATVDLIDVRTPKEFAQVHATPAINQPLDRLDPGAILADRKSEAGSPLYIICHTGARANDAASKMAAAGCEHAVVVEGGTLAWQKAGLPVVTGTKSSGIDVQRQTQLTIGIGVLAGSLLGMFVDPRFGYIAAFMGAGLMMAGTTGLCPLASLIAKLPWNSGDCSSCVVPKAKN
ncbi:MAG: rhodanese-like domain-containing protein [Planctomycetota bacterium]|jgi:rhodanese-related sulfurtransferase|nr:rhodanese-like domain-containing protein [Planctomycetota bacterium]